MLPSLAALPSTLMMSPTFIEFRVHPFHMSPFGLPISQPQFVTALSSSLTSIKNPTCGFIHSIVVTPPVNSMGWSASNSVENE